MVAAKKILYFLINILGINIFFNFLNRRKVRILNYHGISKEDLPVQRWTVINHKKFEWQMNYIRKKYNAVSASDLFLDEHQNNKAEKQRLLITFDDGYENTFKQALPILSKYNLKAICFVVPGLSKDGKLIWTDHVYGILMNRDNQIADLVDFDIDLDSNVTNIDKRADQANRIIKIMKSWKRSKRDQLTAHLIERYEPDPTINAQYKLMTLNQIQDLSTSGVFEIGLHSNTHQIMSRLDSSQQQEEVYTSAKILDENNIDFLPICAYPNGTIDDFNEDTISALKNNSIQIGLTTFDNLYDPDDDKYYIPRIQIGADMGKSEFKARLSGSFYFIRSLVKNE